MQEQFCFQVFVRYGTDLSANEQDNIAPERLSAFLKIDARGQGICTGAIYPTIPLMPESRKAPRHVLRCRAQVNDRAAVGDCILRNLSLRGCYIETANPLPVGSETDLLIFLGDRIVRAGARVRFLHAGSGMGVEFTHLGPRALSILQRLIRELESDRE